MGGMCMFSDVCMWLCYLMRFPLPLSLLHQHLNTHPSLCPRSSPL